MKIPHECKIENVAGSNPTRAHHHLFLDIKADGLGDLVATNGRAIVILPVEVGPEDEPGIISRRIFGIEREEVKNRRTFFDDERDAPKNLIIRCGKDSASAGCVSVSRPDCNYPNYNGVLDEDARGAVEPLTSVSLNAKYLLELQEAMGATGVTLEFLGVNKPIRVRPVCGANTNARAILMPVRTS